MSTHNALEQYPQLLRGYLQATGLLENEEGVIRLGETLTPVIDIWQGRREWALQRGEDWKAARISVGAGGAGTVAAVGLGNPPNSGVVAVLTKLSGYGGAATGLTTMAYTYAVATANWGNLQSGYPMDRRRIGHQLGSIAQIIWGNTPVGVPAGNINIESIQDAAVKHMEFTSLPFVLYAGDAVMCTNNTVAQALITSLMWYERKCVANEARG